MRKGVELLCNKCGNQWYYMPRGCDSFPVNAYVRVSCSRCKSNLKVLLTEDQVRKMGLEPMFVEPVVVEKYIDKPVEDEEEYDHDGPFLNPGKNKDDYYKEISEIERKHAAGEVDMLELENERSRLFKAYWRWNK